MAYRHPHVERPRRDGIQRVTQGRPVRERRQWTVTCLPSPVSTAPQLPHLGTWAALRGPMAGGYRSGIYCAWDAQWGRWERSGGPHGSPARRAVLEDRCPRWLAGVVAWPGPDDPDWDERV